MRNACKDGGYLKDHTYPNPEEVRDLKGILHVICKRTVSSGQVRPKLNSLMQKQTFCVTWKSTKWMRYRISSGQLNQKWLSETCTRGIPWTTACLSWISIAIWEMIAWSFAPTAKTTFKHMQLRFKTFSIINCAQDHQREWSWAWTQEQFLPLKAK